MTPEESPDRPQGDCWPGWLGTCVIITWNIVQNILLKIPSLHVLREKIFAQLLVIKTYLIPGLTTCQYCLSQLIRDKFSNLHFPRREPQPSTRRLLFRLAGDLANIHLEYSTEYLAQNITVYRFEKCKENKSHFLVD